MISQMQGRVKELYHGRDEKAHADDHIPSLCQPSCLGWWTPSDYVMHGSQTTVIYVTQLVLKRERVCVPF